MSSPQENNFIFGLCGLSYKTWQNVTFYYIQTCLDGKCLENALDMEQQPLMQLSGKICY